MKTIAILTGGGDCPGLNAVIRGVVRAAVLKRNWKVLGIADGFDGLVDGPRIIPLDIAAVKGILPRGGPSSAPAIAGTPSPIR
jgi:6-phosphofructokinase 1